MSFSENDTYFFEGKNFNVREARESDLPVWYKWFNNPQITKDLIHGVIPNTLEKQRDFFLAYQDGSSKVIFSILDKNNNKLIGTCSINYHGPLIHGHGEISLIIGDLEYQRGPLYLEITMWQLDHAFYMMNMNSIFSATSEENQTVILTLKKLGFKDIGTMREAAYRNGKYVNAFYQDITRKEWFKIRNK